MRILRELTKAIHVVTFKDAWAECKDEQIICWKDKSLKFRF